MSLIKDSGLATWTTSGNKTVYTLNNRNRSGLPTKLGDVFNHLPSGIVIKSETGMGATTLEIKSPRNSIIVEPLRATAEAKSDKHRGCLFVGTRIGGKTATEDSEIEKYLMDPMITPKKIIAVVDSLPKVIKVIRKIGMKVEDFFLLLDETDSLQLDSGFRNAMNIGIEIYKTFPKEGRATVTATPIDFSDPELSDESITEFKYLVANKRKVELIRTSHCESQIADVVKNILSSNPGNKIVIALNSIKALMNVADHLKMKGLLPGNQIKVLCSSTSKKRVESYFHELTSDKLPGTVNFITAAYFTGFDLDESYHSIVGIQAGSQNLEISELRYKQITGRCRQRLLSETLVFEGEGLTYSDVYDLATLNEFADEELNALNCLTRNYRSDQVQIKEFMLKIREGVVNSTKINGYPLVFEDSEKNFKKAHLMIDSILESCRLRTDVFPVLDGMKNCLESLGFEVNQLDCTPSELLKISGTLLRNDREIQKTMEDRLDIAIDHNQKILVTSESGIEKIAFQIFNDYRDRVDQTYLKKKILSDWSDSKMGMVRLNNLQKELHFACLDERDPMKRYIFDKIKISEVYTKTELTDIMDTILIRTTSFTNSEDSWLYLRRIFDLKQITRDPTKHKIKGYLIDPSKLRILV